MDRRSFIRNMVGASLAAALPAKVVVETLAAPEPVARTTSAFSSEDFAGLLRKHWLHGIRGHLERESPLYSAFRGVAESEARGHRLVFPAGI